MMRLAMLILALMTAFVTSLTYYMLLEDPWLTYKNLPFPVLLEKVSPGQVVPLNVERCNSDKRPHNYRTTHGIESIDTPSVYILPDVVVSIAPGCTTGESRINRVPEDVPPGRYRIFGLAEVPGTLRTHYVEWYSEPFEVIPPK